MILYPSKVSSERVIDDVGTPRRWRRNGSKVPYLWLTCLHFSLPWRSPHSSFFISHSTLPHTALYTNTVSKGVTYTLLSSSKMPPSVIFIYPQYRWYSGIVTSFFYKRQITTKDKAKEKRTRHLHAHVPKFINKKVDHGNAVLWSVLKT